MLRLSWRRHGRGTRLRTFTPSANVENLTLTGAAATDDIGNAKANVITGIGIESILSGFCRH
jgi:hypothetical protein